ncbi:TIGR03619 family F420-dependent LLM class oxidoreductase [Nocardia yamanashiensis]|uniref:TIGR03619 family F420-dependent LLM class oxidoreductase n=1 Tax=Nocardia yamanashiensis TaxID=209247 RepID=UPI00082F257C|nr:TIGR03619 family F420-dependent LLM class oxidoreductase [Nocardia yamanashiensis]
MSIRMGISTPVVLEIPGRTPEWERTAGIAEIARIAETADRLGFDHVTCSEHVAVAEHSASAMLGGSRGTRYWDPLATLSYLAARTARIRLCPSVLVLGYHHPLAIAKRYGTLDVISSGRVVLGVGVGTAREEFELLGASFTDRGRRADESIAALRVALGERKPEFSGRYYRFDGLVVEPHAVQERMPIWVGGSSDAAVRRATALGDGWLPAGVTPELVREKLSRYEPAAKEFEVVVGTAEVIDPIAAPDRAEAVIGALAAAGATIVQPRVRHESLNHYLEQLDALTRLSCFEPLTPAADR